MRREINRRAGHKRNGRIGRHPRRLVNDVKIPREDMQNAEKYVTTLGQIAWLGWLGNDFNDNVFTLRQWVPLPRILAPQNNFKNS